jgi:hypothetical protein
VWKCLSRRCGAQRRASSENERTIHAGDTSDNERSERRNVRMLHAGDTSNNERSERKTHASDTRVTTSEQRTA